MADLDVQPKKQTSWLPWLIAAIVLVLLLLFLLRGCNSTDALAGNADSSGTGSTMDTATAVGATTPANDNGGWDNIDRNAPAASYEEITDKNIDVRGNENYGIYSIGENVLFETDKSTIRKNAETNLKMLATSLDKRFKGGEVRIYGFTDSVGSKGYNKELAQQRAEAVRDWLVSNGGITTDKISLNAIGEGQPVATNATAQGRQQNRRVQVIARKAP